MKKIIAVLVLALTSTLALANQPVRVMISQGPGGITDVGCRTFWTMWEEKTGKKAQPINKPGGQGSIALRVMGEPNGPEFACTGAQNLVYNKVFYPEHAGHEKNVESVAKLIDFPVLIASSLAYDPPKNLAEWKRQTTASDKPLFVGVNTSVGMVWVSLLKKVYGFNIEMVRLKSYKDAAPPLAQNDMAYYIGGNTWDGIAQPWNPNGKFRVHSRIMGNIKGPFWDDKAWHNLASDIPEKGMVLSFLGVGINARMSDQDKAEFRKEVALVLNDPKFKELIEMRVPGSVFSGQALDNKAIEKAIADIKKLGV